MLTYRDFVAALRDLGLEGARVIAHASLSTFGQVAGGAETVVGAMLAVCDGVMMPAFTYSTMVIPPTGPPDNALEYGAADDQNRMAEFWRPDMPVDPAIGLVAEMLRRHPRARRSQHPLLSFTGVNVERALEAQTLEEPLAPVRVLAEEDGDVLLLGVDHTRNTSLHYAERLAGRKQFMRWALTPRGVVACPGWPGCSDGFQAIVPRLVGVARRARLGEAEVKAVPLRDLIHIALGWLREDPEALLCRREDCPRCRAVRAAVAR